MIEKLTSNISDDDLKQAFQEICKWRKTGILEEGTARKIHAMLELEAGFEVPIYSLEGHILFEIAKRHYAN